jgi:hypothetical protein
VSAAEVNAAPSGQFLIYRDGADELRVRLDGETIWLTQAQMLYLDHVAPLQGLKIVLWPGPRALPWAITLRPFGADSKNPLDAIPSPCRQLGSERHTHYGESARAYSSGNSGRTR